MTKVYVLLHKGFEEIEAFTIVDYLRRADIDVTMVAVQDELFVMGDHKIIVKADILFDDINRDDIDLLYIPGGTPGAKGLKNTPQVLDLVRYLYDKEKTIAAICAGPMVLDAAGVVKEKKITSYPGVEEGLDNYGSYSEEVVVVDGKIITSRGPATAVFMALQLIETLKGKDVRDKIAEAILIEYIKWFLFIYPCFY